MRRAKPWCMATRAKTTWWRWRVQWGSREGTVKERKKAVEGRGREGEGEGEREKKISEVFLVSEVAT